MKRIFVLALLLLSLTGFSGADQFGIEKQNSASVNTSLPGQQQFTYLRVHRQGKGVSVNWGILSSSGVVGFRVERSYDGEFFDPICQTPCNGFLKYSYKDTDIFPGYIYYRVACMMVDGTISYSPVDWVRIVQHG